MGIDLIVRSSTRIQQPEDGWRYALIPCYGHSSFAPKSSQSLTVSDPEDLKDIDYIGVVYNASARTSTKIMLYLL